MMKCEPANECMRAVALDATATAAEDRRPLRHLHSRAQFVSRRIDTQKREIGACARGYSDYKLMAAIVACC